MTTTITQSEQAVLTALRDLRAQSGSHSPSIATLTDRIRGLNIRVDACFLSNPYATDLFIGRLITDIVETGELRRVLESYPSSNNQVAGLLEATIDVDRDRIFVCNGAAEAIQVAIHRFAGARVAVIIPTFSPFYEFLRDDQQAFFYKLMRDNDFTLNVGDFVDFVRRNRVDTVSIINPNNPNGGYIPLSAMRELLAEFADLKLVVVDESFVDFAYEDDQLNRQSLATEAAEQPNVVLVKSMSKDFGVAGLRAGYAIMAPERVASVLSNGFLWNVSGLAEFFFRLFGDSEFQIEYLETRMRYLSEAIPFFAALRDVDGLTTFPTKANFCLCALDSTVSLEMLVSLLLARHGIYVRDCSDKVGLEDGQYIRVASRKQDDNTRIINALKDLIPQCAVLS